MEDTYSQEETERLLREKEIKSLDDVYMIEDVAMYILKINKDIDFYKVYKKKKNDAVDDKINKLEGKIDFLKQVILKTLEKDKRRNINFPGSCQVKTRKQPHKWVIKDEKSFIDLLKEEKEFDNVAEEVKLNKVNKKEVNNLLDDWKKSNKIPDYVECEEKPLSITISNLEEEVKEETVEEEHNFNVSEKDFDELNS